MNTRTMTEAELLEYFSDSSQCGVIAEENGRVVGWIGWNRSSGFFAHSAFCDPEHPSAFPALVQELRRLARLCGEPAITFVVDVDNPTLLALTRKGRARIISHVLELEA